MNFAVEMLAFLVIAHRCVFSTPMLLFVALVLLPIAQVVSQMENIAEGKRTQQCCTVGTFYSRNPVRRHPSCSETRRGKGKWWEVNLGDTYSIKAVEITNEMRPTFHRSEYVTLQPVHMSVHARIDTRTHVQAPHTHIHHTHTHTHTHTHAHTHTHTRTHTHTHTHTHTNTHTHTHTHTHSFCLSWNPNNGYCHH